MFPIIAYQMTNATGLRREFEVVYAIYRVHAFYFGMPT